MGLTGVQRNSGHLCVLPSNECVFVRIALNPSTHKLGLKCLSQVTVTKPVSGC